MLSVIFSELFHISTRDSFNSLTAVWPWQNFKRHDNKTSFEAVVLRTKSESGITRNFMAYLVAFSPIFRIIGVTFGTFSGKSELEIEVCGTGKKIIP